MKNINLFILVGLFTSQFACTSMKNNNTSNPVLSATQLQPFGRYQINSHQQLELISSAVHFGFTFTGSQCSLYAFNADKQGHNYLQFELDGVYQKRIKVTGDTSQPIIITANGDKPHTVWIYKATEAHTGAIIIDKITGQHLQSIAPADAPVIEFIGNSITCGAAADASEVPCGQGVYHDQHNAYYAYGPRVARALNVNYILSSVSGIGIYRNWNSDGPTMPQVYEKTNFQEQSKKLWNFKKYSPAIVSIALGTNDFSHGDGIKRRAQFDSSEFVSIYVAFIHLVKSKYPSAVIALLSSPMTGGKERIQLQNCLRAVKVQVDADYPSGKAVSLYFFNEMHPHGCSYHPSVEDHAILADELLPFYKSLL